jgi:hypothetical protein
MFLSASKINNSVMHFNENIMHNKPNFGTTSYLSEIKPLNNYNTSLDTSKFGYNTDNVLRLSNLSAFSNIK